MNINLDFENRRWSGFEQKEVFRHQVALSMIKDGKVLDFGCGDGFFLQKAKEKGLAVEGCDISEVAVQKCVDKGLKARLINSDHSDLDNGQRYDYVVCLDVLEHVLEPATLLRKLAKLGDKIIIAVPNFSSLPARIQTILGRVPENNKPGKGHVFWFNHQVLMRMIHENGLQVDEIETNAQLADSLIFAKIFHGLSRIIPNLFALSFVVRLSTRKVDGKDIEG